MAAGAPTGKFQPVPPSGKWILGAGPTFIFPTAPSTFTGQGPWQAGPGVVVGYLSDKFLLALFPQQWDIWTVPVGLALGKVLKLGRLTRSRSWPRGRLPGAVFVVRYTLTRGGRRCDVWWWV